MFGHLIPKYLVISLKLNKTLIAQHSYSDLYEINSRFAFRNYDCKETNEHKSFII